MASQPVTQSTQDVDFFIRRYRTRRHRISLLLFDEAVPDDDDGHRPAIALDRRHADDESTAPDHRKRPTKLEHDLERRPDSGRSIAYEQHTVSADVDAAALSPYRAPAPLPELESNRSGKSVRASHRPGELLHS